MDGFDEREGCARDSVATCIASGGNDGIGGCASVGMRDLVCSALVDLVVRGPVVGNDMAMGRGRNSHLHNLGGLV